MKKITKISLAAVIALAGLQNVAMAGDNLAEAFTNGKVKGQVKSYYFAKDYKNNAYDDASIWVNGVVLGYKTGDFYGLNLGVTGQFSSTTSDDDNDGRYNGTMNTSGTVMSEAYIGYTINNTALKIGRQFFWTPVVGGSGSRFNRQAFEGYSLVNTDIPDTKITAAYMTKFAARTDRAGEPGEFVKGNKEVGNDGIWTIYAKNTSVKNLTLQAQYASRSEKANNTNDGVDTLYLDANYNFGGNMKPYVAAQYLTTSYEDASIDDAKAYGVKVGANIAGVTAYVAYTSVGDSSVTQGFGSGSIPLFTNGAAVDAWSATFSDTDAYKVGLGYKIGSLSLDTAYASFDRDNQKKVTDTNFTATYKVNKNLTAQVQYSILDNQYFAAAEADMNTDLRTRLIYSF